MAKHPWDEKEALNYLSCRKTTKVLRIVCCPRFLSLSIVAYRIRRDILPQLRLPAMLYDELTPGSGVLHTGPEDKASRLKEIFDIVRSNLQRASLEQARHYNLRRREWRPTLGSQVWLRQHPLSKAAEGFAAKTRSQIRRSLYRREVYVSKLGSPAAPGRPTATDRQYITA